MDDSYGAPFHGISPDSFYQYVEDAIQADLNLTFQGMTQQHLENIIDRRIQASLR